MDPIDPWLCRFADRPDIVSVLEKVIGLWRAPDRHYHGVDHLVAALANAHWLAARHLDHAAIDLEVVDLALWFHDAIYDATASDNERRSADLAVEWLQGMCEPGKLDRVQQLILLTAGHEVDADDLEGRLVVDADLAILGADKADYDAYCAGVRREYGHLDDSTFTAGRSAFLASILDRERIFNTDAAHHAWHSQARANMSAELERLARGSQ